MRNAVSWFQIQAKDGKKLQAFYKKVFSWKTSAAKGGPPMMMVEAEKGGIPGAVGNSQNGKSSVAVYVDTDNLARHLQKIKAAGGKIAMPPMELPGGMGHIAGFTDPAGNWMGLWQPAKKKPARPAKKR
jgi:hypothetical protein